MFLQPPTNSSTNVNLPSLTSLFLVLANSPWRRSGLQVSKSYKELKQPDVNSALPICIILLNTEAAFLKPASQRNTAQQEARMRAEDLKAIMTEGEGGQGNNHNNKQQHKKCRNRSDKEKLMTATTGTER